jgi:predicted PurR-regulated permease PerM
MGKEPTPHTQRSNAQAVYPGCVESEPTLGGLPASTVSVAKRIGEPSSQSPETSVMPLPIPRSDPPPRDVYPAAAKPRSSRDAFVVGAAAIAGLYFARDIFVPLALAMLLSFALGPLVMALRRRHLGRVPSVIAAVILAFLVIFGIGSMIGTQLEHLAENLPQYQSNITAKIHELRGATAGVGLVERATDVLKQLSNELTGPAPSADQHRPNSLAAPPKGAPRQAPVAAPIPVEIRQPDPTAFQVLQAVVGPLLQPLATTGLVIVFVVFMLLKREDLRDRFIRLAGARDLQRTTRALDDAAQRLSRYLLVQTAINGSFGLLVATGLWIIGIPNPVLWGSLGMLLRFVPYVGPVIAAIFPAILAVAVDPGWMMLFWTAVLFLSVELTIGQAVEPLLYGRSTGLSAVAVVVAAAFWTWLWGPVGLLLSTPLTLCLVVLGRHVEHLEFLDIVLGDRPALTMGETFYQRVLAHDPGEAAHQAEIFLKTHSLATYYDEVAIRGLALAQSDVNRGALDHEHRARIKTAVEEIIDDLSDHADAPPAAAAEPAAASSSPIEVAPHWRDHAVMCVGGRGSLDEAAAAMLAQLLDKHGIGAFVAPSDTVSAASLSRLDATGVQLACLSYLEPGGFSHARYLVRRLRRKLPRATIIVGFWTFTEADAAQRGALEETGADRIVISLQQAVDLVTATARPTEPVHRPAGSAPQPEAKRVATGA